MASPTIQLMTRSSQAFRLASTSNRYLMRSQLYSTKSRSQSGTVTSNSPRADLSKSISFLPCRGCQSRSWRVTRPQLVAQHQFHTTRHVLNEASRGEMKPAGSVLPDRNSTPISQTTPPAILTQLNPLSPKTPDSHEYIWTLPNILTFSRLAATPVIGYTILTSQPYLALSLFAYASITDLVDGYIARRYNLQTVVGTVIDPMADKALVTTVVICTTLQGLLPVWLAVIILGRDVALAISAIYFRYISLPPPKTFARYWDFSLPSAEVRPTEISKINTLLQLLLIGNAMVLPALSGELVNAWNLVGVFEGWQYLVATTTVWSGLSYIWSKDAVKILSVEEAKAKEAAMGKGKTGTELK